MAMRKFSGHFWALAAIVLAAFAYVSIHSWRISTPLKDTVFIPKEEVITPEIELLQSYVRIDTSNPPGREMAGARFLVEELGKWGIKSELIESAPGRANVYARIKGRQEGDGLLLLNHIDVVPVDETTWSEPPFAARTKMNMLYGRGALDMKSIAICQLLAFAEIASSGIAPQRDVVFLATADEEEGGELGLGWLLEHRPDVVEGIRYALNEGGISETLEEKLTYFGVEVGTRQVVKIKIQSTNRRTLERARIALMPLQEPRDPTRVLPEVASILKDMSRFRKQNKLLLADIEKTIADGNMYLLEVPYKALVVNSVSPSGIHPNPTGGFEMDVVLNNLPDERPEDAIETIRRRVAPHGVTLIVVRTAGPSPISPVNTPLFGIIRKAVAAEYGRDVFVGPLILPFSTNDSRYLRPRGIHAYGVWPFPVSLYQTWGIHGVDERIRLDWFMQGVSLTRRIVEEFALSQDLSG